MQPNATSDLGLHCLVITLLGVNTYFLYTGSSTVCIRAHREVAIGLCVVPKNSGSLSRIDFDFSQAPIPSKASTRPSF